MLYPRYFKLIFLDTIITSFPSRYGARNPDPSDVRQSLCQRLANVKMDEVVSVYDLAITILDQCCKVFFDRLRPLDERPEVLDIFANSISHVVRFTGEFLVEAAN
jgi:hypothetical protein